ncbi:MAG: outer membrane lipoprotein LolB [Gammaproteobacteria bacterium]|nr:outer membrane lipoprotein LolB [Gammaproteobacteria bacterium]
MSLFFRVFFLSLGLVACSTIPQVPPVTAWEPLDWTQWRLQGRMALRYQDKNWNVSLRWQQYPTTYNMVLQGPLGVGTIRIDVDEQQAHLTDSDGHQQVAASAEQLLYNQTGMRLPLSRLRYWVLADYTVIKADEQTLDAQGRPVSVVQDGWIIHYKRYQVINGYVVPRLIYLQGKDVELRLVIDQLEPLLSSRHE